LNNSQESCQRSNENEQCKYDWEHFIYLAKQSHKVTLIGQSTCGAFDYIEPLQFMLSTGKFYLEIPVARSSRVPQYKLNGIGIQPDIFINDSKIDWVQFALQYLTNK
jgi:C-terminal processing protease CtpA/Prc